MANMIPLLAPGDPGYISPERWQEMSDERRVHRQRAIEAADSVSLLRYLYVEDMVTLQEFERRIANVLARGVRLTIPGLHPTPIPTMDTGLGRLYGYPDDEALFAAMDAKPRPASLPTPTAVQLRVELQQQRRQPGA